MKGKDSKHSNSEEMFIEDGGDKRIIVFIALAAVVIISIILFLLIGCEKNVEANEPGEDIILPTNPDGSEDEDEELNDTVVKKTSVIKTTTKEKEIFKVKFYYNDQYPVVKSIKEGETVTPYRPKGMDTCSYYYTDSDEFDFRNGITGNIDIYMECTPVEYTIEYDVVTSNPNTYDILDGNVTLTLEDAGNDIFVGWYSDNTFTNKVSMLTYDNVVVLADTNKVVHLYARIVASFNYNVYNSSGVEVTGNRITKGYTTFDTPSQNNSYCQSNEKHYGWSTTLGSAIIEYDLAEEITIENDLNLYPVCGNTEITYKSEDIIQEKEVIKTTDIDDYELPDDEDLDMENPIYYLPVEEASDTSLEVVANDTTPDEKQIKLEIVEDHAAEGYIPLIGDNVIEHEKILDGWTTEDTDMSSPTVGEQIPVPDDYTPPVDENVELNANWVEPIPYNPSVGG